MNRPAEQPLFDLSAFEVEHKPSIQRQKVMQEAAKAEIEDTAIPLDVRVMHLRRARRWIDTLIEQAQEGQA